MRILVGGQVVEDIDSCYRVHERFLVFSATYSSANDYSEGFGFVFQYATTSNIYVDTIST